MTKHVITGLLTLSLSFAVMPLTALARDHHDNRGGHKYHQSYQQHRPAAPNKRIFKSHNSRYAPTVIRVHTDRNYKYEQRYYKQRHSHRHNNYHHIHRQGAYIENYYTILGGSILINELLHHSHDHY